MISKGQTTVASQRPYPQSRLRVAILLSAKERPWFWWRCVVTCGCVRPLARPAWLENNRESAP